MKRLLLLGSVFCSLLLAACGGGGGSSPNPLPSTAPTLAPVSYSAKLVFVGALAGHTVQSDLRAAESVALDATATPLPIMVVSPIAADGTIDGSPANSFGGTVQAVVSPMPSASPSATFANTNPYAALASPAPQPLPTGVIAEAGVFSNGTQNAQGAGTASANIGSPVDQTPTTAVYAYRGIAIQCGTSIPAGTASAWKYDGTQFVPVADQTQADVYMAGPGCDTPSGTSTTLNFPGGAVALSTDNAFCSLATGQLVNPSTSLDMATMNVRNGDGSFNGVIIAKTADGLHTFKMFPNSFGIGNYGGAIEVSGSSVDGF